MQSQLLLIKKDIERSVNSIHGYIATSIHG